MFSKLRGLAGAWRFPLCLLLLQDSSSTRNTVKNIVLLPTNSNLTSSVCVCVTHKYVLQASMSVWRWGRLLYSTEIALNIYSVEDVFLWSFSYMFRGKLTRNADVHIWLVIYYAYTMYLKITIINVIVSVTVMTHCAVHGEAPFWIFVRFLSFAVSDF